jgi:hypothetical protein
MATDLLLEKGWLQNKKRSPHIQLSSGVKNACRRDLCWRGDPLEVSAVVQVEKCKLLLVFVFVSPQISSHFDDAG